VTNPTGDETDDLRLAWQLVEQFETIGDRDALERAAAHLRVLPVTNDADIAAEHCYLLGVVELYLADLLAAAEQPVVPHAGNAVKYLTQALAAGRDADWSGDAQRRLGRAHAYQYWAGDLQACDRAIDCLWAAAPDDGDATLGLLLADRWERRHDPADLDAAIDQLERTLDPTNPFPGHALGLTLAYRWERSRVRADLDRAIDLLDGGGVIYASFGLAHACLRHERAVLDDNGDELSEVIGLFTDLAGDPRCADDPAVHIELGIARWHRFRRTGEVSDCEGATAALTVVLDRPRLDPDAAKALRLFRSVIWASSPDTPGLTSAEQAERMQALRDAFQDTMDELGTGRAFQPAAGADGVPPLDVTPPARYARIVDQEMVAEHQRQSRAKLDELGPDHPQRATASAFIGLAGTAGRFLRVGEYQSPTESVELITDWYANAADPTQRRLARGVLAAELLERGVREGRNDDVEAAVEHLRVVLDETPRDESIHRHLRKGLAGALYNRFRIRGDLHDLETAMDLIQEIVDTAAEDSEVEADMMRASLAEITEALAVCRGDWDGAIGAIVELEEIATRLPPEHPGAWETETNLGLLRTKIGLKTAYAPPAPGAGPAEPLRIGRLIDDAHATFGGDSKRANAMFAVASAIVASTPYDESLLRTAVAYGRQALLLTDSDSAVYPRYAVGLGMALYLLVKCDGDQAHVSEAIGWLGQAIDNAGDPSHPDWCSAHILLGKFHRLRGERDHSRQLGLLGLRGNRWKVLLQSGTDRAMAVANESVFDPAEVAAWCFNDGAAADAVAALDAGRAAILHSATAVGDLPSQLEAVGAADLATRWRTQPADQVDPELRYAAMKALTGVDHLLDSPSIDEIRHALRIAGADSLAYLFTTPDRRAGGAAVVVPADAAPEVLALPAFSDAPHGLLDRYIQRYEAARSDPMEYQRWREALHHLLDWAGNTAIRPLLTRHDRVRHPRIVLVPMGRLALVPWHAARLGRDPAIRQATWSYAASARLFVNIAGRPPVRPDAGSLIVGDPDNTLWFAGREALAIRQAFYPNACYLGQPPSLADGPGVPAEVLDWLAGDDRQVLHLACHGVVQEGAADTSYLKLAGGQQLTAEELIELARPGGLDLVSLAACTTHLPTRGYDEAFSLATAFLVAGARAAIGSLWPVPDQATSLLMFMTHYYLRHDRRDPADALRLAQLWMADPRRRAIPEMPPDLVSLADDPNLADPVAWAGFTHVGA